MAVTLAEMVIRKQKGLKEFWKESGWIENREQKKRKDQSQVSGLSRLKEQGHCLC